MFPIVIFLIKNVYLKRNSDRKNETVVFDLYSAVDSVKSQKHLDKGKDYSM